MGNPLQPTKMIAYKPIRKFNSKDIIRDLATSFLFVWLYFLISKIWDDESSFSWLVLIALWVVAFFRFLNRRKVKGIWIEEDSKEITFLYKPFLNKVKSIKYKLNQVSIEAEHRSSIIKRSKEIYLNFIVDDINVIDLDSEKDDYSQETIGEILKTAQHFLVPVTYKK